MDAITKVEIITRPHKLDELNNLCRYICMKCPQMDEANELLNKILEKAFLR